MLVPRDFEADARKKRHCPPDARAPSGSWRFIPCWTSLLGSMGGFVDGASRSRHSCLRFSFLCAIVSAGCASVFGLDLEGYRTSDKNAADGHTQGGGSTGYGGATGIGGSSAGGAPAQGGMNTSPEAGACAPACSAGRKCCGTTCVLPSPEMGCSPTDCTPCPQAIPNADRLCVVDACSARCALGYVPYDGACVLASSFDASADGAASTGGMTGSGGSSNASGGGTGICNSASCPSCTSNPQGPVRCCTQSGQCACSWFNAGTTGYCL